VTDLALKRRAALLRGINLGGRKLLMSDLTAICTELGFQTPRTLLASGNVVFAAGSSTAEVEVALEAALARFGLKTDVLVRDGTELDEVIHANPFGDAVQDHPSHVLVTFHREPFPLDALDRLRAVHEGPEQLAAIGRELFVDYGGREQMRASTLLVSMRKARFPSIATARNWNTVTKLAEVLRSPS
jgi:uncharacterized protein (DUF1697 family)